MSHSASEQRALNAARAAYEGARLATARLLAEQAAAVAALRDATRSLAGGDPELARLAAARADVERRLTSARADEREAKTAVGTALFTWLGPTVASDVATMTADLPLVLLPVRLETRFHPIGAPTVVRVRIYPDAIHGDTHEPWLTPSERDAAEAYWREAWTPANEAAAWRRLLASLPSPRAAWVVRALQPVNIAGRPAGAPIFPVVQLRPASWTRAAEARLLPDRWIVRGYRLDAGGTLQEVAQKEGLPIAEPLALTLNPNPDADAEQPLADNLIVDDDAAWAFDFAAALGVGMALELPLPTVAPELGFDRLLAVGVKASLAPAQPSNRLGELLDAHHFTRGLAFVPQGTPTNNTSGRASGFPPPDPGGTVSFDIERGAPIGERESDGRLWLRALGLTDRHLDLHLGCIDRRDGRVTEQQAARAMSEALWPATLGYFLEQTMAPVFSPAAIAEAKRYCVDHVRGRGPYPAFRVGGTPYGLLPVSSLDRWAPLGQAWSLLALTLAVRRRRWRTPPAACSAGRNVLDIFVHDPALGLQHRVLEDGGSDWQLFPGELASSPAAASSEVGRVDVVARGSDDRLLHRMRRGRERGDGRWSDWEVLEGAFLGDPALCSWGAGRLDAFGVDHHGELLHRSIERSGWSDWEPLGGEVVRDPAAASWAPGRIDVVARNERDELVHRSFRLETGGGVWSDWEAVGLDVAGRPAIAASVDGRLDVVVTRADGRLHHLSYMEAGPQAGWSAATGLDGDPGTLPVLTESGRGRLELLALDPEGRLLRRSGPIPRLGEEFQWSSWTLVDPDVHRADLRVGRRLGVDGQAAGGWRTVAEIPEAVGAVPVAAALAAGDLTGSSRPDLVVVRIERSAGEVRASYAVRFDLDAFGRPTGANGPLLPLPDPLPADTVGAAIALADVSGDGRLDLVVLTVAPAGGLAYRVGFGLDANGSVTGGWSSWHSVPGGPGSAVAGGVAVADVSGDGRLDLVAFNIAEASGLRDGFYRVGLSLDATGAVTGGWSAPIRVPDSFGPAAEAFAIAVADLDRSGRPDLVVSWTDHAAAEHRARYRIGAGLDTGGVAGVWTAPLELPDAVAAETPSHSVTLASLDARPVVGDRLAGMLRSLREEWRQGIDGVPRVGGSDDADADLLGLLGMDASAREVRVRSVLGREFLFNAQRFLGLGYFGMVDGARWPAWLDEQRAVVNQALRAIGPPAWDPSANAPTWNPRLGGMVFDEQHPRFAHTLVTLRTNVDLPVSEERPLEPQNYIAWLLEHGGSIADVRGNFGGLAGEQPPLLALLLRHSLLLEHARIGLDLLEARTGTVQDRRERELVGLPVAGPSGVPEVARTIWDTLAAPPVPGEPPLAEQLAGLWDQSTAGDGPFRTVQLALAALRDLPTAELERLLTETLDVFSHRLDAWITSLAANRLEELRRAFPEGGHLAAFGWVEDLHPGVSDRYRTVTLGSRQLRIQKDSGGFVQAPSATHAAAAAILRNAYLTRRGADRQRFAIALSSSRVRAARSLLDAVRDGESLGAGLGARVERGLHERSQAASAAASLEQFIDPLRDAFPLIADKGPVTAAPADPPATAAARNVLDGLTLRAAWPFDLSRIAAAADPSVVAALRAALDEEINALDEVLDATADLLCAEAVHQIVQGNPTAAAATLDALAQGVRPPDPTIASAPRGGTPLTHRFAVVLGDPPVTASAGWPATLTARAAASPELDGWVGSMLGEPDRIRCRAQAHNPDGTTVSREVTVRDLDLRPLDLLALARTSFTAEPASELDRRVAWVVAAGAAEGARIEIAHAAAPDWDRATTRTFPEALELARAVDAVVAGARPLRPDDLIPPEAAGTVSDASWLGEAALLRAHSAEDELIAVEDLVATVLAKVAPTGLGSLTPADLDTLRGGLVRAANLGVPGAFPTRRKGATDEVRSELTDQARSVHQELQRRTAQAEAFEQELAALPTPVTEADKARYATDIARVVLGRDTTFLVAFRPTADRELAQALGAVGTIAGATAAARDNALRAWVQQAARVQPPLARWRRLALYAETLGPSLSLEVAQLPFQPGERWVGLPLDQSPPANGRVSLVMHRVATPAADDTWTGLLVDEWTELVPSASEVTGIAYHYDDPGAEAPQAVLIAVPPDAKSTWDLATLTDVLHETLELAKLRAVDGELVGELAQLLPAIHLAANHAGDTISVDFRTARVGD